MLRNDVYEVDQIIGKKYMNSRVLYLVRWKGFTSDHDSWEPGANLGACRLLIKRYNEEHNQGTPDSESASPADGSNSSSSSRKRSNPDTSSTPSSQLDKGPVPKKQKLSKKSKPNSHDRLGDKSSRKSLNETPGSGQGKKIFSKGQQLKNTGSNVRGDKVRKLNTVGDLHKVSDHLVVNENGDVGKSFGSQDCKDASCGGGKIGNRLSQSGVITGKVKQSAPVVDPGRKIILSKPQNGSEHSKERTEQIGRVLDIQKCKKSVDKNLMKAACSSSTKVVKTKRDNGVGVENKHSKSCSGKVNSKSSVDSATLIGDKDSGLEETVDLTKSPSDSTPFFTPTESIEISDEEDDDDDGEDVLYSLNSDCDTKGDAASGDGDFSKRDSTGSKSSSIIEISDVVTGTTSTGKTKKKKGGVSLLQSKHKDELWTDKAGDALIRPVSPPPPPHFTTVKESTVTPLDNPEPSKPSGPGPTSPEASDDVSACWTSWCLPQQPATLHQRSFGGSVVERRASVRASECAFRYKQIVVKKCFHFTQIWLSTQTPMKNALNPAVIQELISALNSAKYDDSHLVLFSGFGPVFCSGTDLHYLVTGDRRQAARQMAERIRELTKTLISFPKPIIAAVSGAAVGLGVALLLLCDVVYASDKASFHLPYSQLSQTPEGCSSFTLPHTLGFPSANELLFGGRKITAMEAYQLGLVSQVFWPTLMMQEVIPRAQNMAASSAKALEASKLLVRSHYRTKMELTNETECNLLLERWLSVDCQHAIEAYIANEKNWAF